MHQRNVIRNKHISPWHSDSDSDCNRLRSSLYPASSVSTDRSLGRTVLNFLAVCRCVPGQYRVHSACRARDENEDPG
ncbi:unnamed protein product [Arctia plantaginis]|uniref:Uncharacterized protein n=1 Tax=Arctia plantaginis TaxID=874455 RepID=A0A8S1AK24_ARCPL|nr:unnamed protein product [Arctia plantaginis]